MTKNTSRTLTALGVMLVIAAIGGTLAWRLATPRWSRKVAVTPPKAGPAPRHIRVLVANIKLADPADGVNRWSKRRRLLLTVFRKYHAQIMGLQESTPAQTAYLGLHLHNYAHYPGIGGAANVFKALTGALASWDQIFFRADRFSLVTASHGALRPNHPQRNATENAYYSLVVLADRRHVLPDIIVIDTHLRHGVPNAAICAQHIQIRLRQAWQRFPNALAVVMGDMNHDRTVTPVYRALEGFPGAARQPLWKMTDAFNYAAKPAGVWWGTWQDFTGQPHEEWPSDLIFVSHGWRYTPSYIIRDHSPQGRYPTDHFLVTTVVAPRRRLDAPALMVIPKRHGVRSGK